MRYAFPLLAFLILAGCDSSDHTPRVGGTWNGSFDHEGAFFDVTMRLNEFSGKEVSGTVSTCEGGGSTPSRTTPYAGEHDHPALVLEVVEGDGDATFTGTVSDDNFGTTGVRRNRETHHLHKRSLFPQLRELLKVSASHVCR